MRATETKTIVIAALKCQIEENLSQNISMPLIQKPKS